MLRRTGWLCLLAMLTLSVQVHAQDKKTEKKDVKKTSGVWTDPADPSLPADFKLQGEYVGTKVGCQTIALGNGEFQAVVCSGGLPGDGWDGGKSLLAGKLTSAGIKFEPATGKRKYLAGPAVEFSATSTFPPKGHQEYSGSLAGDTLTLTSANGNALTLKKTERKSPTLGAKAPSGALVLFDGSSTDNFNGGRLDKTTGLLNTDGKDLRTKKKFLNYTVHLEFMLPYRPDARGQGRGNSGFYQVDQYEVQILDSFGLEGKNNECGGIYTRLDPKVNMCLPPLQWQTYDIDFTAAVAENGKVMKKARITARHNGVVIHDNAEIAGPTGGARMEPEGTPGSLQLQGHGNPLQFRNFWVIEK